MNWMNKLERKLDRFAIPNLMQYISATMVVVLVFSALPYGPNPIEWSVLLWNKVMQGQIWRLLTFVFVPPTGVSLLAFLVIYFYYYIGRTLEYNWGTTRFNLYYLMGMVGTIIAAAITGYGTSTFLNFSLFLAFATLFPNNEVLLFLFIPMKVKYLAWVELAMYAWSFLFGTNAIRLSIIASLINYILFFGPDVWRRWRDYFRYAHSRRQFRANQGNFDRDRWR